MARSAVFGDVCQSWIGTALGGNTPMASRLQVLSVLVCDHFGRPASAAPVIRAGVGLGMEQLTVAGSLSLRLGLLEHLDALTTEGPPSTASPTAGSSLDSHPAAGQNRDLAAEACKGLRPVPMATTEAPIYDEALGKCDSQSPAHWCRGETRGSSETAPERVVRRFLRPRAVNVKARSKSPVCSASGR